MKPIPEGLCLRLDARTYRNGALTIAACDRIGIKDQGRNRAEALANLAETLERFFAACAEQNTLWAFLATRGIRPSGEQPDDAAGHPVPAAGRIEPLVIPLVTEAMGGTHAVDDRPHTRQ